MFWNSDKSTYHNGKKVYGKGAEIPEKALKAMGMETVKEYKAKGFLIDEKPKADEFIRLDRLQKAKDLGLSPHPKTGVEKLDKMIDDFEALQELKKEALELGIAPADDVEYAELKELVDKVNESDS